MNINKLYIIICLISFASAVKSQGLCDTLPFINCDANEIVYSENDSNINPFIQKIILWYRHCSR